MADNFATIVTWWKYIIFNGIKKKKIKYDKSKHD